MRRRCKNAVRLTSVSGIATALLTKAGAKTATDDQSSKLEQLRARRSEECYSGDAICTLARLSSTSEAENDIRARWVFARVPENDFVPKQVRKGRA